MKKEVKVPTEYFERLRLLKEDAQGELKNLIGWDKGKLWQLMGYIEAITDQFTQNQ
jgi:hypothetical protein